MEVVLIPVLLGALGYLMWDEFKKTRHVTEGGSLGSRKRLCDYWTAGSVFDDIPTVLSRGVRLIELHVYSDEQGYPIVSKHTLSEGYDYAEDNWTFEECCIAILNGAFPSSDPMIISIVPHTENAVTMNRMAEHLKTTVRRHLIEGDVTRRPIDSLANKLIIVSGGNIQGTELEELVNMSWMGSELRRLTYNQAVHTRDQPELVAYNRNRISIVSIDEGFGKSNVNPDTVLAYGCQWNLFATPRSVVGFVEKPHGLQ